MIVVVTPETAAEHGELLEEVYRLRHRVFVDERGWKAWTKPDGLERDRFDPGGSTSFIAMQDHKVVGNARLVPGGGMNGELVTEEKLAAIEARAQICGLGRFCVAGETRGGSKVRNIGAHLMVKVLEHARDNDIPEIFFETDPWFIALLRLLKIKVITVGEPMPYYGREMVMGFVPISNEVIAKCRQMLKLEAPLTREARTGLFSR